MENLYRKLEAISKIILRGLEAGLPAALDGEN